MARNYARPISDALGIPCSLRVCVCVCMHACLCGCLGRGFFVDSFHLSLFFSRFSHFTSKLLSRGSCGDTLPALQSQRSAADDVKKPERMYRFIKVSKNNVH